MKQLCIALFLYCLIPNGVWGQMQTLEGQVIAQQNRQPVAGVELKLLRGNDVVQSIKSDENGRYKFFVEAATYELSVVKQPDYVVQTYRGITIWGGSAKEFNIVLEPCVGLCSEHIYQVPKPLYDPNENGTGARFSDKALIRNR